MRTLRRGVAAATLLMSGLLILAPAGASAAVSIAKTCQTLQTLEETLAEVGPTSADEVALDDLTKAGKAFRNASKTVPKKVKSSLVKLATLYQAFGGSDSPADALSEYAKNERKVVKLLTKLAAYSDANCELSTETATTTPSSGGPHRESPTSR